MTASATFSANNQILVTPETRRYGRSRFSPTPLYPCVPQERQTGGAPPVMNGTNTTTPPLPPTPHSPFPTPHIS